MFDDQAPSATPTTGSAATPWWRRGAIHEISPRSFSDADGIGDLRGITAKPAYEASLGVTGVWLNPINPSPNLDWGDDVTDYRGVHPDLGTLEDFDALLAEAGRVGLRVLLDLVPNHTSEQHPWFAEARRSPVAPRRGWYVWAPTGPEGAPPNNWRSLFDVPAWSPSEQPGVAYLHNFLPEQPDLNRWNGAVREEFAGIVDFWLRRGVAGFPVDVANALRHDRELRDDPPLEGDGPHDIVKLGQRPTRSLNRPEAVDVHAGRRAQVEAHAGADGVLLGETRAYGYETLGALHTGGARCTWAATSRGSRRRSSPPRCRRRSSGPSSTPRRSGTPGSARTTSRPCCCWWRR